MPAVRVAAVVVAYNSALHLAETLRSIDHQLQPDDELLVLDNASTDGSAEVTRASAPRARVLRLERNLGFAGGCNAAANAVGPELLFFLNPDARLQEGCLDQLRDAGTRHPDWGAWQALVTLPGGREVNTSGGVVHFLGFGWAGGWGVPVAAIPAQDQEIAFASGAALMVRRSAWKLSGGFDPDYFMYGEDLDLSLRLRLLGLRVGVVPSARVEHSYEFDKGRRKWFWLERNRWWTIIRVYPASLLALLVPALALMELGLILLAARGGWLSAKLRADAAVLASLPALRRKRAITQRTRRVDAKTFAGALSATLDSPYLTEARRLRPLVSLQGCYWRFVQAGLAIHR